MDESACYSDAILGYTVIASLSSLIINLLLSSGLIIVCSVSLPPAISYAYSILVSILRFIWITDNEVKNEADSQSNTTEMQPCNV